MAKKIAVVLCGSGYLDGSEVRESVGVLWSLSDLNTEVQCFAPDANQHHVMNTLKQEEATNETRNMLVESARIARSDVKPLTELNINEFDGLAIPGGFGVAKNLCTFAFEGSGASIDESMKSLVTAFHQAKKPILAVCIAPALVGLALQGTKLELTLGAAGEASAELEKLGHTHCEHAAHEFHHDKANKIISTPAYMYDSASLKDIFTGIRSAAEAFLGDC